MTQLRKNEMRSLRARLPWESGISNYWGNCSSNVPQVRKNSKNWMMPFRIQELSRTPDYLSQEVAKYQDRPTICNQGT